MALPLAWLLLSALPLWAQTDPVPGKVVAPSSTVQVVRTLPTLGGASLEPSRGESFVPGHLQGLRMGNAAFSTTRGRDAFLRGLETMARKDPKDLEVKQALQRGIVEDELEHIEPRLTGKELTPERKEQVLAATLYRDVRWYHRWDTSVDPDGTGVPDGRQYPDGRIAMFVKSGWHKMPDIIGHYRVLFAHEYTHRLQGDGSIGWRGAFIEIPAYATEILRALELHPLEALKKEVLPTIGPGVLSSFEGGRQWMREASKTQSTDGFYHRGFLAGAAYEAAQLTGVWSDAWLYHRLVSTGMDPKAAKAQVLKELPQ